MRIYWFFIWRKLNPLHPRMICAKNGWNWLSGSGEEDFLISPIYFRYFIIIYLTTFEKEWSPSFEKTLIFNSLPPPPPQGCFVPSLFEIDSVILEKIF